MWVCSLHRKYAYLSKTDKRYALVKLVFILFPLTYILMNTNNKKTSTKILAKKLVSFEKAPAKVKIKVFKQFVEHFFQFQGKSICLAACLIGCGGKRDFSAKKVPIYCSPPRKGFVQTFWNALFQMPLHHIPSCFRLQLLLMFTRIEGIDWCRSWIERLFSLFQQ